MSELDKILTEYEEMDELDRAGPPLPNARYEIFASHVATGTTPANAYRIAYNHEENSNVAGRPTALLQKPAVRKRIGQLLHARTEMLINRALISERNVMDELAWGIKNSRDDRKFKDHHAYVMSTAKILGMLIETDKKAELADKSLEELREEARLLEAELKIPPPSPPSLPPGDDDV